MTYKVYKLDLHGIKHEDVEGMVVRFIEKHWNKQRELEIITGHSTKMKGLVINIIMEYELLYHVGYLYERDGPRIITWT